MNVRVWPVVLLAAITLLACGGETETGSASPEEPVDVAGSYRVNGVTTELASGATREIGGMLILAQEGDAYTASFHLNTMFPTEDGILPAEVVGTGDGKIDGRSFAGSAETQLILGIVPGEAGAFPLAPRIYGPRLLSKSSGKVKSDGSLAFESINEGAPGEAYQGTKTALSGTRVATDWTKGKAGWEDPPAR